MAGASGMADEVSESFLSLESDPDLEPSSPKRSKISSAVVTRKWSGAARYKTRFQHIWQEKCPFVTVVRGEPYSFRCAVCNKLVSCGHQGEKDVSRHYNSSQHKKNVVVLANTQKLNFRPSASVQSQKEKVRSQCFNVCCIAARKHCYYTGFIV